MNKTDHSCRNSTIAIAKLPSNFPPFAYHRGEVLQKGEEVWERSGSLSLSVPLRRKAKEEGPFKKVGQGGNKTRTERMLPECLANLTVNVADISKATLNYSLRPVCEKTPNIPRLPMSTGVGCKCSCSGEGCGGGERGGGTRESLKLPSPPPPPPLLLSRQGDLEQETNDERREDDGGRLEVCLRLK